MGDGASIAQNRKSDANTDCAARENREMLAKHSGAPARYSATAVMMDEIGVFTAGGNRLGPDANGLRLEIALLLKQSAEEARRNKGQAVTAQEKAADREIVRYIIDKHPKAVDWYEKQLLKNGTKEDQQGYKDLLRRYEQELIAPVTDKSISKAERERRFYENVKDAHEIALRESNINYHLIGKAHRSSIGRLGVDDERIGLGTKDARDRKESLQAARYNFEGQMIQNNLDGVTNKDHFRLAYCFAQLSRVDRELGNTVKADTELAEALKQKLSVKEARELKNVIANPKKFWEIHNAKSW
jgi:hypothetical protein